MKLLIAGAVAAAALAAAVVAAAGNGTPINPNSANPLTIAVYGDAPYGTSNADHAEFDATPAFIDAINHDPRVDLVAHVGDIHSGSQACTEAYDRSVADLWAAYKDPLVYTPGDNEWSDCQKAKQLNSVPPVASYAGGDPIANLALVRTLFFPNAGHTLGGRPKQVISQAQVTPPAGHATDVQYVENVMWEQSKTVFFTLNIPGGSNNDDDNWFGHARTQAQTDEIANRSQADLDWIDAAFDQAQTDGAGAVVIFAQADMWDQEQANSHLTNYKQFVDEIAARAGTFGRPVLLFNGDSHVYRVDDPLVDSTSTCWIEPSSGADVVPCVNKAYDKQPNGYDVPNFRRIVVHGSTFPLEYTRLTIDPGANNAGSATGFGPFSWTRAH